MFLGIELVDQELHPLAEKTDYVINRMKEFGILMSSDRPNHTIIKIKPPLTFTIENAQEVIFYLQKIFDEDFMKIIWDLKQGTLVLLKTNHFRGC